MASFTVATLACGETPTPTAEVSARIEARPSGEMVVVSIDTAPEMMVHVGLRSSPSSRGARTDARGHATIEVPAEPGPQIVLPVSFERHSSLDREVRVSRPLVLAYDSALEQMRCPAASCGVGLDWGTLHASSFAEGTTIRMGSARAVSNGNDATIQLDAVALASRWDLARALAEGPLALPDPLTIEMPGGEPWEGPVDVSLAARMRLLTLALVPAARGGTVALPPATGRAVAVMEVREEGGDPHASTLRIVGDAHALSDLAAVALVRPIPRAVADCGRYTAPSTGESLVVRREATDADVRVIDARTGALSEQRVIRGPTPACPSQLSAYVSVGRVVGADIDQRAIDRFLLGRR